MTKQKWFLIVNPSAGAGKLRKLWKHIEAQLQKLDIAYSFAFTEAPGHATSLCQEALAAGYRQFVAVGGDGTAHELVNALAEQKEVALSELLFAIIPVGTGNDWIKTHEIPNNYKKAILLLKTKNRSKQDLGLMRYVDAQGQMQSRYFLNVAGMGYDAFVTKASNEQRGRRLAGSKLFYYYLIVSCSTKYKHCSARVILNEGEQVFEGNWYSMALGICIYNGGGAQFVPHAKPNDGLFALTLVRPVSIMDLLLSSGKFYNGKIGEHPKVETYTVRSLRIEPIEGAPNPIGLEADGEFLGYGPMDFEILPSALHIVVP